VAAELGCAWHTVNATVVTYGEVLLDADDERIGAVTALGLDEVLMVRIGPYHRHHFSTQIVDVRVGQLLDIVPGRSSAEPMGWLANRGRAFRDGIEFGTLDLSGPYRRVFDVMLPRAVQVADPFHLVKLANSKLDECRRRRRCWPLHRAASASARYLAWRAAEVLGRVTSRAAQP
jgi:transposase